jgi:hypothetical protein
MCCGNSRQQFRRSNAPSMQTRPVPTAARPASISPESAATASAPPSPVTFEYVGKTGLTVISPTTGIRYRFDRPGSQLSVDPRDHTLLLYVPNLRPVNSANPKG